MSFEGLAVVPVTKGEVVSRIPSLETRGVRIGIAERTTAALTLLASALGTVAANADRYTAEQPRSLVVATEHVDIGVGGQDVLPGPGELYLPGVDATVKATTTHEVTHPGKWQLEPREVQEAVSSVHTIQDMAWARLFDRDPRVGEALDGGQQLRHVVDTIHQLKQSGFTIDSLDYKGSASSENVTSGERGARLDKDDPENVATALRRAEAVKADLEQLFPAAASMARAVEGVEAEDTVLNQAIRTIAKKRGIPPKELVLGYNKNTLELTKREREVLDALAAQRYVGITINAHHTVTTMERVYREGEWIERQQDEHQGVVVLVPIIVPYVRGARGAAVEPVLPVPIATAKTPMPQRRAPRVLGQATPGYSRPARHHRQPTYLNNGAGRGVSRAGRHR